MAVSSRRSSTEGYQSELFSDVCSLSRAQSAHARSTPWAQLQHQKYAQAPSLRAWMGVPPPLAGAGLYIRARRYRRCPHARARETGNKTHHGPPVAPPDRAWCVLFRVSRAHVAMCYRCRGLLGGARFQVLHQKYLVVGEKVSRTDT